MQQYLREKISDDIDMKQTKVQIYRKKAKNSTHKHKKELSPEESRQFMLKKYEKQLKQFLNQNKKEKKQQLKSESSNSHIFLNWGNQQQAVKPTERRNKQRYKTMDNQLPLINPNKPYSQQKNSQVTNPKNRRNIKLRKSQQLVLTRYNASIQSSSKRLFEKKDDNNNKKNAVNLSKVKLEKINHEKQEKQSKGENEKNEVNEFLQAPVQNKKQINNPRESIYTTNSKGSKFLKRTLFCEMVLNQKELNIQRKYLENLENQHKLLNKIPSKQQLPNYIKNYKPFDKSFNLLELAKDKERFVILHFKDTVYIGQSEIQNQKRIRSGKGIYITNRSIFQGEFINNQKIFGIQQIQQGTYKGHFKNNLRNGRGEFRWKNQEYYSGQWKDNKKHGSGVWTSSTSQNKSPDTYFGEWNQGKVQGNGVHIWNNGKCRYQGEFLNFLKNGSGIQKFPNGDKYQGHYKDGKVEGYGQYYWADGSFYKGNFINGMRSGQGIWQEVNGDRYQGNLEKDCKAGKGKIFYANGEIFQGFFQNNMREGEGILKKENEIIIKGVWHEDVLITKIQKEQ